MKAYRKQEEVKMTKIEKTARKMALAWINANRKKSNMQPLKRPKVLWWKQNGQAWLNAAREIIEGYEGLRVPFP